MEEIIKRNPDKILIMTHAVPEEAKKTVEEEFAKSTWQQLDAIKNKIKLFKNDTILDILIIIILVLVMLYSFNINVFDVIGG